jgi:hypothetical protein
MAQEQRENKREAYRQYEALWERCPNYWRRLLYGMKHAEKVIYERLD